MSIVWSEGISECFLEVYFVVFVCVYLFFVFVFLVLLLPIENFLINSIEVIISPLQWFSVVLMLRNPDKFLLIML